MNIRKFPVYLALVGAAACGPNVQDRETAVFRIDTDECRITEAETPWLDIEIRYGDLWTNRGQYNSATGNLRNVAFNRKYFDQRVPYEQVMERSKFGLVQCAQEDLGRQKRPVRFRVAEQ